MAGTTSLSINIYSFLTNGWVAFDDVSLQVGGGPNLVPNPSFEGTTGWTEYHATEFPATSFFRSSWGTAAPRTGTYAYALSNHGYGWLESEPITITASSTYILGAQVRGYIDHESSICEFAAESSARRSGNQCGHRRW